MKLLLITAYVRASPVPVTMLPITSEVDLLNDVREIVDLKHHNQSALMLTVIGIKS